MTTQSALFTAFTGKVAMRLSGVSVRARSDAAFESIRRRYSHTRSGAWTLLKIV